MAIAFVTATEQGFTAATSYTVTGFTVTGTNNYALVMVGLRTNLGDITGVTFNGTAMTELGTVNRALSTMTTWLFGLAGPTTGNVVVTGDTSLAAQVIVSHYQGVVQTGSTGTFASATGTGTTPSVAVTSATDEMVVDAAAWLTGGDGTAGAGQTERAEGDQGDVFDLATSDEAGAASVTMSWTVTDGAGWTILGIPLKPLVETTTTSSSSTTTTTSSSTTSTTTSSSTTSTTTSSSSTTSTTTSSSSTTSTTSSTSSTTSSSSSSSSTTTSNTESTTSSTTSSSSSTTSSSSSTTSTSSSTSTTTSSSSTTSTSSSTSTTTSSSSTTSTTSSTSSTTSSTSSSTSSTTTQPPYLVPEVDLQPFKPLIDAVDLPTPELEVWPNL